MSTDAKLLPCPFCGATPDVTVATKGSFFSCSNEDCPIGGWSITEEEWGIRAVQPTPPLVWSTEPPTVAGQWWVETRDTGNGERIVYVVCLSSQQLKPDRWNRINRFAGPIPEPQEPKP